MSDDDDNYSILMDDFTTIPIQTNNIKWYRREDCLWTILITTIIIIIVSIIVLLHFNF
jgi:hypothetical protein